MNDVIIYKGVKYFQKYKSYKHGRYYHSNLRNKGIETALHRRIWQEANGDIPSGMIVHHINENPEDNRLENLMLMSRPEHQSLHTKKLFENTEYRKKNKENILKVVNSDEFKAKSKAWRDSEAGKLFYSTRPSPWSYQSKVDCVCKRCSSVFKSYKPNKIFCRDACRTSFRRKSMFTDKRICLHCKCTFMAHKYQHVQHCSRKCSALRQAQIKN